MSWPFAQVVAICLLFLALHEWLANRRWWMLGFLLGLTAATRISTGLHILLFSAAALFTGNERSKNVGALGLGFAIPIVLLAIYNAVRFHSIFETGYNYQPFAPGDFPSTSLTNVLPHLRIFLLGPPMVTDRFPFFATNPFGMSVLLLSPWLLYIGSLKFDRFTFIALISCAVVLLAVLAWRSTGQIQVGYRFSLDFLPVLMFLLARDGFGGNQLPRGSKFLL